MSKKTIYLHIGTHKTATTTIQAGCVENRATLLAAGYLFPSTGMYLFGQHNIAWEMAEGQPQPWNHVSSRVRFRSGGGDMAALLQEINASPADGVILSSEDFDGLHDDRIRRLHKHLTNFNVQVIVYFREQTSLWQSAWAQFIKSGFIPSSFNEWAEEMLASPAAVQRYFGRYDLFLKPWAETFGKENLHVRRYGVDAYGETIFLDFLRTCHITDVSRYIVPGNQNISPSLPALELCRHFSRQVVDPDLRMRISGLVQSFMGEHGSLGGKFHLVSEDLSRRMVTHFLTYNQIVAREYLGVDSLFPEPKHDKPVTKFSIGELDPGLLQELELFIGDRMK